MSTTSTPASPTSSSKRRVGTTAADLAAGDTLAQANAYADSVAGSGGGSFVGAYATVEAPAANSVEVGFYYFDTTLAAPFWSDGTTWVSGGGAEPPPGPVPLTVGFTAVPGETFAPWVGLTTPTTVTWHTSTGTVLGTGVTAVVHRPDERHHHHGRRRRGRRRLLELRLQQHPRRRSGVATGVVQLARRRR